MSKLTGANIEQYRSGGSGKSGFFSLKDDKDTAQVRLLYNGAEDIEGYVVHRVKVGDYERPVNCLLEDGGSIEDCPFCQAGIKKQARMFIPLYNEDAEQVQIWERPNSFYGKISGLCARYPNIVSRIFEIERNGEKGYQKTDYSFYPIGDADGTTIDDILEDCGLDELPKVLGTSVLDKTADDMDYYLKNGEFPDRSSAPIRRRGSEDDTSRSEKRRGRGDRF